MTENKATISAISFKLTNELREYLRSEADAGFRSISKEIVMRLERTRQQDIANQQPTTSKEIK